MISEIRVLIDAGEDLGQLAHTLRIAHLRMNVIRSLGRAKCHCRAFRPPRSFPASKKREGRVSPAPFCYLQPISHAAAAKATRINARSASFRLSISRLPSGRLCWPRAGRLAVVVALQHLRADGFLDVGDGILQRQPILHFVLAAVDQWSDDGSLDPFVELLQIVCSFVRTCVCPFRQA